MLSNRTLFNLLALASLLFPVGTQANDVVDRGFEWRTLHSSDILIGEVVQAPEELCAFDSRCATVRVLSSAKGIQAGQIRVLFAGPISEMNPICCKVGGTYLFYLNRVRNSELYATSDGPFGVYRLDKMYK